MADAATFFTPEEKQQVVNAVKQAELATSGEIRVHLENACKEDVLDHAAFIFEQLEMHKTEQRNGVLFYLAVKEHKFAILGDGGINAKVPEHFWEDIKNDMATAFKNGEFADGLSAGIIKAGEQLKAHFPYQQDDKNELSDDISVSQ